MLRVCSTPFNIPHLTSDFSIYHHHHSMFTFMSQLSVTVANDPTYLSNSASYNIVFIRRQKEQPTEKRPCRPTVKATCFLLDGDL